jgi:hypothetical protein
MAAMAEMIDLKISQNLFFGTDTTSVTALADFLFHLFHHHDDRMRRAATMSSYPDGE